MTLVHSLPHTIRAWRGKRSMRDIARAAECQHSQVSRMEREPAENASGPTVLQLEAVAKGLGVETYELVAGRRKEDLVLDILRQSGWVGGFAALQDLLKLAQDLPPETIRALRRMAHERPTAFATLLELWRSPELAQVAEEAKDKTR